MSDADPTRVFLLEEWSFERLSGPLVFGSHESARRWVATKYGVTERGWWKVREGRWERRVKNSWGTGKNILVIEEHEVLQ